MGEVTLIMKDIDKSFVRVHALKNACLELKKGEVHALMGENGAGKSALMKILAGTYSKDSGTIVHEGRQVEFKSPREAQDAGIVIVHQELNMMNHLTMAQNVSINKEKMNGKLINGRRIVEEAKKLFGLLNIRTDPRETMGRLTVGRQQMCEIAKAIFIDAKIIVFNESIVVPINSEISELFKIIRDLRARDIGIVYISHRMDEIDQVTGRVTVMRDGEYVGTLITRDPTKDDITQMVVRRTVYEEPKSFSNVKSSALVVLKVEHLNIGKTVKDVGFEPRKGEILGLSGLMGAGRTEIARAIFGTGRRGSGGIYVDGKRVDIRNPQDAVDAGIGYLSEDRERYGVIIEKTVAENTTMVSLKALRKGLFIDKNAGKETTEQYVEALKTKTPSVEQQMRNPSGGNQQKVAIAKWLTRNCDILILDEPTGGIDVGAKSEIYTLMGSLVKQGKSITMISSELTGVLRTSDRILVMYEGRKTGEISIEEATQEKIMHIATLRG